MASLRPSQNLITQPPPAQPLRVSPKPTKKRRFQSVAFFISQETAMRLIRLTFPIVLTLAVLLAGFSILARFAPHPAQAAPATQTSTTTPFWRFLDTAGDGTGTKNATGTYTSTRFYLQPPTGAVYNVSRLVVSVEDSAVVTPTLYGGVTITNGVLLRRVSGSTVITLTDGISVTNNIGWRHFCTVTTTSLSGVTNQLQAVCDFNPPIRLNGDKSETLEALLADTFTGLDGHYFVAEGYKE